jgi:glutathione S-transferase
MANTSRRTRKRAAPGRDELRARKSGSSKAAKPESRKSNPANKRTSAATPKAIRKERSDLASVASLRARMTAVSRVLELIGGSRSDSQPVFDASAASARDLTGAMYCSIVRLEDGLVKIAASSGWSDGALAAMNRAYPRKSEWSALPAVSRWYKQVSDRRSFAEAYYKGARLTLNTGHS